MSQKNQNLIVRLTTAAVLIPLVLFLLSWGPLPAAGLMAFGAAVCAVEYYRITLDKRLGFAGFVGAGLSATFPLTTVLLPSHVGDYCFWATGGFFLFAWLTRLLRMDGPLQEAPTRAAHLLMGLLYGGIGLTALAAIRAFERGLWWVVVVMVVTWMNDTLAYFSGRFFGRHKLYPEVSPNKTWEGFAGGVVGSIGGLLAMRALVFADLSVRDCLVMGVLGALLGPAGDLCESLLKRAYGVKDSSNLFPGHGGMLDRVDALLFNAPMVFVYLKFAKGLA